MANISPERRARLQGEKARNASGGTYYSFKNLTQDVIRLLPLKEDEDIGVKVVSYFINNKSFVCPEATFGKPSVIAKAKRALQRLDDDKAQEFAKALDDAYRTKYVMKIISRLEPTVPKLMEAPKAIYEAAFACFEKDGEDVSDVKEGSDIRWSKEGSNKSTKYSARVLKPSILIKDPDELKSLLKAAEALDRNSAIEPDEKGAAEALEEIIPAELWDKIRADVVGEGGGSERGRDDERPAKGKRKDDDEDNRDDERPAKGDGKGKARDDDDEGERPAKNRDDRPAKARDDDGDDDRGDARPAKRRDDDDGDERPARGKDRDDDRPAKRDEEERPARTTRRDDDDGDERPARSTRRDEDADGDRPAKRRDDDDGDARPAKRRDDDDRGRDDDRPAKTEGKGAAGRFKVPDDEDERPAKRR